MASPDGFTESEWRALGAHTCPRDPRRCNCQVHYGVDSDSEWTGLRVVEAPKPTVINRTPARQPWEPKLPRRFRDAA